MNKIKKLVKLIGELNKLALKVIELVGSLTLLALAIKGLMSI